MVSSYLDQLCFELFNPISIRLFAKLIGSSGAPLIGTSWRQNGWPECSRQKKKNLENIT